MMISKIDENRDEYKLNPEVMFMFQIEHHLLHSQFRKKGN